MTLCVSSGLRTCLCLVLAALILNAAQQQSMVQHRGMVKFGGLPVQGASVTLRAKDLKQNAITDANGGYAFEVSGAFTIDVQMPLFASQRREFAAPEAMSEWELELLAPQELTAKLRRINPPAPVLIAKQAPAAKSNTRKATPPPAPQTPATPAPAPTELEQRAADGFLINGSVNNASNSPFSQLPAFGNNRRGQRSLYNGNLGWILNQALFDARAYSLTGQSTVKPDYSRSQGVFAFGGPFRIPGLMRSNGPNFTINYQWTRNTTATTQTGLMPTAAEREGRFTSVIQDPLNGLPFAENRIPASRLNLQALALLRLYPEANFTSNSRYNFQIPLVNGYHQDDLQTRANKTVGRNTFSGNFAWQSTRTDSPDVFGFLDTGRVSGVSTGLGYRRNLTPRIFLNTSLNFSRLSTQVSPYFAGRRNLSGEAGIRGNDQAPSSWGSPNLLFSNGIQALTMPQSSQLRNQTVGFSSDVFFNRRGHNIQTGISLRRQQFNVLAQQDARGTLNFTGAASGNDFAGFLLGIPDTAAIAFGNADKYLRANISEAFANDDWRISPSLTVNYGLRWEYWSPLREKYGRLVNLDVSPTFASAVPSRTLPRSDRNNLAPRLAFSWRPILASSLVVRGGYGIYYDTSVYQPIAMEMAQQAPLSKSLRVANTPATPLTLSNPFPALGIATANTYAVDPNLRIGYSQTWLFSIQRDLPRALQLTATYNGGKGSHAQQQFLPNTFPNGAIVPSGFTYLSSNGNSIRHSGQIQVRRRLRGGFTAQVQYSWAKSLDNAMLGGRGRALVAQNWLNLAAERGRSNFDQRHLATVNMQYTIGQRMRGKGWAGLLRDWTLASQINWGSGLPLSPVYVGAIRGTGVTGSLRPDYTGADLYDAPAGFYLNPKALAAPAGGAWGNAGRNSITGPRQFVVNSSLAKTFRSSERISFDVRVDASNATNTPTFTSWNTVLGNSQFGLPNVVNPMRSAQVTARMRF